MPDPDYKALCVELVELSAPTDSISQLAERLQKLAELANRTRAVLAQPEPVAPTDKELLELMPEEMRDDLAELSRIAAQHHGLKPGIFRVMLNTNVMAYARAVLAHYRTPANKPVPVSVRLPEPDDCIDEGWAWFFNQRTSLKKQALSEVAATVAGGNITPERGATIRLALEALPDD